MKNLYFVKQDKRLQTEFPENIFLLHRIANSEIKNIKEIKTVVFGDVCRYLDGISNPVLKELKNMVDVFANAGVGKTERKIMAKSRFDKYLQVRGV